MSQLKEFLNNITPNELLSIQKDCIQACARSSNQPAQSHILGAPKVEDILLNTDRERIGDKVFEHWTLCGTLHSAGYDKYLSKKTYNLLVDYKVYKLLEQKRN